MKAETKQWHTYGFHPASLFEASLETLIFWMDLKRFMVDAAGIRKKEAKRKKSLGEIGELYGIKALVDNGFTNIRNLNDVRMNYPYADVFAERNGRKFVISIKARNKWDITGDLNGRYRLMYSKNAFQNAENAEKEFDAEAAWMAIPFEKDEYSVYFGTLKELDDNKAILIRKCMNGEIGETFVLDKYHYLDGDFFRNK